ncbi:hypothetical protein [Burkholderia ambifaria]|uniref:hypothetical protein n=1 Tax=Burkholderia ambifaria TaxID=152480 RepID=UPI001FC8A0D7|nr:hypothetical protein [Burkholderia ambifaria]
MIQIDEHPFELAVHVPIDGVQDFRAIHRDNRDTGGPLFDIQILIARRRIHT